MKYSAQQHSYQARFPQSYGLWSVVRCRWIIDDVIVTIYWYPFQSEPTTPHQQHSSMAKKQNAKASSSEKDDASAKGKGKAKDSSSSSSKLKPATSINVRHILCEKHSRKEDALTKIRDGAKFDDVAREFSEDKARQGELLQSLL